MTSFYSSLRFRLLMLVVLALLPALLLTIRSGFEQRKLAAEGAQEDAIRLARIVDNHNAAMIEGARQLLIAVAQTSEVRGGDIDVCSDFLNNLREQYHNYSSLSVFDNNKTLLCTSLTNFGTLDIPEQLLDTAIEKVDFAIGNYKLRGNAQFAAAPYAYPVLNDEGQVKGVVLAFLDMEWFYNLAVEVQLPEDASLLVVDPQGTILARHPDPEIWIGVSIPEAPLINTIISQRGEGFAEIPGVDGILRLNAFTPLQGVQVESTFVNIGIPTQIAYADANRELFQNLAILSLVAVLTIIITWIFSDRFVIAPTGVLISTIRRLENGDLSARANLNPKYGEISLLANSFDQMAVSLEQREQQVLHAEAKYRTLVEQVPAVIYTISLEDDIKVYYISPQVEDVLGYSSQEWLNDPQIWIMGIHPEDRERVLNTLQISIRNQEPFKSEYRFFSRDGAQRWINDEALLVYDENGEPLMLQGLMLDITARRQAEASLRTYAVQLERSNRELLDFAYIASHDLQEPLRKIQAFGERLDTKFGDLLQDEGRGYLERMRSSAARMQNLINDLLSYSRVTTKAQPFVKVDLNHITSDVLSDLGERIKETKGEVQIEDLPEIEADPLQMRLLMQNLIANALKFHHPGNPPRIYLSCNWKSNVNGEPKFVELFVKDNGIGFEEKYLDRIFQPFQRLHGRGVYEGSGIGLAICRKIVERHNGTISARSKLGEGSTFIITLPVRNMEKL